MIDIDRFEVILDDIAGGNCLQSSTKNSMAAYCCCRKQR